MRRALMFWAVLLGIVAAIMVPLAVAEWVAGTLGMLIVFGVFMVAFFVWLTVMAVEDMRTREEYREWREKHRNGSYP